MMPQKRMECFRQLLDHLAWIKHLFLCGIRDSRKTGSLWGMMKGVGGVRKSIQQSWLAKGLVLGLLCWGFKGVQRDSIRRGQHSTNRVSGLSTRTMHHSTTLSLSQSIWARGTPRQFFTLPVVQTLLPVTFGYSLSSEDVVMRQLRRWKRLWRRSLTRSHTRGLPWGLVEVVGTVQQVHYSRKRLLRMGLEFHVCTINKMTIRKKSWNLFNEPRTTTRCREGSYSVPCIAPLTLDPHLIMLIIKEASSTIFWVFGFTRPGIESWSHRPLAIL